MIVTSLLMQVITASAQLNFNPHENDEIYGTYNRMSKVKNWDSVALLEYKSKYTPTKYTYKGQFSGNVMHGFGELDGGGFIYTGQWKMGKPHGFGHFKGKGNRRYEFKGSFEEGFPKEGLFIGAFHKNKPHLFYSGEVALKEKYNGKQIIWHGYGTVLRTDRVEWDNHGLPGSFYSGQFYNNCATGFGITNTISENEVDLNSLAICLSLGGRVVHVIEQLPLHTDFLMSNEFEVSLSNNHSLLKLLPLLNTAKMHYTSTIDSLTSYTGSMHNLMPYGLGYADYVDGFRDIGFWFEGKKIHPKELLQSILPSPSVLEPVVKEEWDRILVQHVSKYNPQKKTYEWEWKKKKMQYYAPFNSKGMPEGWGWKTSVDEEDDLSSAGYFNGTLTHKKEQQNADVLHVLISEEIHRSLFSQQYYYSGSDNKRTEFSSYFSDYSGQFIPVSFTANKITDERKNLPWVAYADDRYRKADLVKHITAEKEKNKIARDEWKKRPVLMMYKIVISKSNLLNSYVSDGKQNVKGTMMSRTALKVWDYVLVGDKMKRVSMVFPSHVMLNDMTTLHFKDNREEYVIRSHRLETPIHSWKCEACNGVGSYKNDRPVAVITGYKEELAQYNSTYKTVKLVPVYSQIGSVAGRNACSACKGVGQEEKILTMVEMIN